MAMKKVAWVKFIIVVFYMVILGAVLIWAWIVCPPATRVFHEHFNAAEKEEVFLDELEVTLDCSTDDDKEIEAYKVYSNENLRKPLKFQKCWQNIQMSFIKDWWLEALLIVFFVGHAIAILVIPLFNRSMLIK